MSKVDIEEFSYDYQGWSGDDQDQKNFPRKNMRNQNMNRDNESDDFYDDDHQEDVKKNRKRKSLERRREIEDRLDRRRLEKEIGGDYYDDWD